MEEEKGARRHCERDRWMPFSSLKQETDSVTKVNIFDFIQH